MKQPLGRTGLPVVAFLTFVASAKQVAKTGGRGKEVLSVASGFFDEVVLIFLGGYLLWIWSTHEPWASWLRMCRAAS